MFRRVLELLRIDDAANHNYSVWFSAEPRVFQRLQWGGCTVVRTRDPNRFCRALALHFAGHGAPRPGLLRTDGIVAVQGDRAIVLPPSFRRQIPTYERPLREAGILLHDAPLVDFDPARGEVVLEPSGLEGVRFDEVARRLPPARHPDPVPDFGRYGLAGWYFDPITGLEDTISTADAVAIVLSQLRAPLTESEQAAALARMFEGTIFKRLPFQSPRELLNRIQT